MRMAKFFLLFLSLCFISCATFNPHMQSITSGDIRTFLKQAPRAEDHANAGVSVLFSYRYLEYFDNGNSVLRRAERIKIFNERGRDFATQSISYREGYNDVHLLYAHTITPDGKVIALNKKDIHDATAHVGYDFYTDIKEKRFTMPAVEDGCIIEFAYEIKNLKTTLPFDLSGRIFLKDYHPIEKKIVEIVLPAHIDLKYKQFHTTLAPRIIEINGKRKYIFQSERQKEMLREFRMPDLRDRNTFPEVAFWTMTDWNQMSRWYIKVVERQMTPNPELVRFTKHLIAGKKTDEEIIREIFRFVAQKVRYVCVSLGPHSHEPHAATDIFHKRYGDCKDKTTLLLSMLKIAGIDGHPVLVPSNPEYFNEAIPSLNAFNHVIAVVSQNGKTYWLDATRENAAFNAPPFLRPATVCVIQADGSYRFVKTPAPDDKKDFSRVDCVYRINEPGDADVDLTMTGWGMAAEDIRNEFKYMSPDERKKYFEERRGIELQELNFGSFTETDTPFTVNLKGRIKNHIHKLDDDMMVLTGAVGMDTFRDITAARKREYPVVFHPSLHSESMDRYIFPSGFRIRKIPQALTLDTPFIYRTENFVFQDSTLTISVSHKEKEHKISAEQIDEFKRHAVEMQKRELKLKNIVFEKK